MLASKAARAILRTYQAWICWIALDYLRVGSAVTEGKSCSLQRRSQSNLRIFLCMAAVVCLLQSSLSAADDRLNALVNGTDVTPPVSGLQIVIIENGEVGQALSETMIAGNMASMLNDIVGISKEHLDLGGEDFPWIRIANLNFS